MGSWCLHSCIFYPIFTVAEGCCCLLVFLLDLVDKFLEIAPQFLRIPILGFVVISTFRYVALCSCLMQLLLLSPLRFLLLCTVKNVWLFEYARFRRLKMLSWQWVRIWGPFFHLALFLGFSLLFWNLSLLFFAIAIIIIITCSFMVLWSVLAFFGVFGSSLSFLAFSYSVTYLNTLRWR